MLRDKQMSFGDISPEYKEFVDKFKPKKTTDDCYTPENIYNTVLSWVRAEYKLPPETKIIRPFWPGGNYEAENYEGGGAWSWTILHSR